MAKNPDISIISVNFNGINHTRELLYSIETFLGDISYEVIVVDNGSIEDEASILSEEFKSHKFIRSQINLGFSGGNNLGIMASSGEFIFLLNNDALLVDDSIIELVKTFKMDPKIGVLSPKIYYQDSENIIQYAGFTEFSRITIRNRVIGNREYDNGQYNSLSETASAHGAAMMIRMEAVDKAGLMPEIFFLYYEEHDWCAKIKKRGYKVMYQPKSSIIHKESQSTGVNSYLKTYYNSRNRILFAYRNRENVIRYISILYLILIANSKDFLKFLFIGRADLAKAVFNGVRDFFKLKNKLIN